MRYFWEISQAGVTALLLHPLRSLVTTTVVVIALVPYVAGLGVARGVADQAEAALRFGADLYVSGEQLGRPVPIPIATAAALRKLPGVVKVVPRIVGHIELGQEHVGAVLVGVPVEDFPKALAAIDGRLYGGSKRNELAIGSDLARRLHLGVGARLPPFYHSQHGERVSEVVGIFRSEVSIWQSRLAVTALTTAGHILDQPDLATDLLVTCRPGYQDAVRQAIVRQITPPAGSAHLHVVSRDELADLLPQGLWHREGAFTALHVLAFVAAILVILVTSGFGLSARRREIGILKATGWQTDELLLRSLVESVLISLAGASLAILLAFLWLVGLGGFGIARIFLPGMDAAPGFGVPFRLTPVPVLLAFLIALLVVLGGSTYSTWRAATAPPREAMR